VLHELQLQEDGACWTEETGCDRGAPDATRDSDRSGFNLATADLLGLPFSEQ
jgi:hypothetical protein